MIMKILTVNTGQDTRAQTPEKRNLDGIPQTPY